MRGSRRGRSRGSAPPPENHKNIWFLSNTGLDPLKNHKATKPAYNVGPFRPTHFQADKFDHTHSLFEPKIK